MTQDAGSGSEGSSSPDDGAPPDPREVEEILEGARRTVEKADHYISVGLARGVMITGLCGTTLAIALRAIAPHPPIPLDALSGFQGVELLLMLLGEVATLIGVSLASWRATAWGIKAFQEPSIDSLAGLLDQELLDRLHRERSGRDETDSEKLGDCVRCFRHAYGLKTTFQMFLTLAGSTLAGVVYKDFGGEWALINLLALSVVYAGYGPTRARRDRWARRRVARLLDTNLPPDLLERADADCD